MPPTRCLIVDVETTGFDPDHDPMIELGLVLYSITNRTTISQYSALLPASSNAAEAVNRIPVAALKEARETHVAAAHDAIIAAMCEKADLLVSYNIDFDRQWFVPPRPMFWLCAQKDFIWPRSTKPAGSLVHVALEHDVPVAKAHRALVDAQLIASLFDRMPDLGAMFDAALMRATQPRWIFKALVSYDDREQAKRAGFRWDNESRSWMKQMTHDEARTLGFSVAPVREVRRDLPAGLQLMLPARL